jgi:hypothetical protein
MAYQLSWLSEDRILLNTLSGEITAKEIKSYTSRILQMMDEAEHPFHVITDMRQVEMMPPMNEFSKAIAPLTDREMRGWLLAVTTNPLMRMMGNIAVQLAGGKSRLFKSVDEALLFIEELE